MSALRSTLRAAALLAVAGVDLSCGKVPLVDVGADFRLADVSWFEAEQTMFVFYQVEAEQGLGDPSVVEISFRTDTERVEWTPLSAFDPVHTHLAVDCGAKALCGSTSFRVPDEPRAVRLRLRYHRDGALSLDAPTVFNVVGPGAPHERSMVVYGVFDATNEWVQWRGRHQFPTVRNERAEALGLRRRFTVEDQVMADRAVIPGGNPYGYGVTCQDPAPLPLPPVTTDARAVFNPAPLPIEASTRPLVCASATVTDALGPFTATAVARKNPEVKTAFPVLRSPVDDARVLPFFLAPCDRTISDDHEAMQRQRLLLGDLPPTCIDDWDTDPGFVAGLVTLFRDAIEAERPAGRDMVLVVGIHQDEGGMASKVEEALAQVAPRERHRTTPRLAGAFVFDSDIRGLQDGDLKQVTLWCPSTLPTADLPDVSQRSCAVLPDNLELELGPFSLGTLPILPSREQYLDFIDTYGVRNAGSVQSLAFLTPEFAASADHVDLGEFGVVTFLNGEAITAEQGDAFSFCLPEEPLPFVFSSDLLDNVSTYGLSPEDCAALGLPADACEALASGLLPIDYLPDWHNDLRESTYDLGVFWEFPFLLRMEYETFAAGAATAFGFSVPFGVRSSEEGNYGAAVWTDEELELGNALLQCTRFCEHPTFDSAGVYHPSDLFRPTYATTCYLPDLPAPGDDGFPRDP